MPIIIEAEDIDGNVASWVVDSETLEKLYAQLGEPDAFLVADCAA
jgi:hypothetical protein